MSVTIHEMQIDVKESGTQAPLGSRSGVAEVAGRFARAGCDACGTPGEIEDGLSQCPRLPSLRTPFIALSPRLQVDGQLNDNHQRTNCSAWKCASRKAGCRPWSCASAISDRCRAASANAVFETELFSSSAHTRLLRAMCDSPTEIFRGKITALEGRFPRPGPPELVVLAEGCAARRAYATPTKTWDVIPLGDIVTRFANGLGLTPQINGLDATSAPNNNSTKPISRFLRRLLGTLRRGPAGGGR